MGKIKKLTEDRKRRNPRHNENIRNRRDVPKRDFESTEPVVREFGPSSSQPRIQRASPKKTFRKPRRPVDPDALKFPVDLPDECNDIIMG